MHYVEVNGPPVWTDPANWLAARTVHEARDFSIYIPPTAFVDPNGHTFTIACKLSDDTTPCPNTHTTPTTDPNNCAGSDPCFDPAKNRIYGNLDVGAYTAPTGPTIKLYATDSLGKVSAAADVALVITAN